MKTSGRPRGFTLVELLVVIGIIALLVSILLPALQRAKEQSVRVKCAAHLHNVGASLHIYANDFKGKLPQHASSPVWWLWDIPFGTRDALLKSGNKRETLYCAGSSLLGHDQNADALWNYGGGYCVSGYFWMMKRPNSNLPAFFQPPGQPNRYRYHDKMTVKDASRMEIASDPVLSVGNSFTNVKGGWSGIHSTPHMRKSKPDGGNVLFLDGHAAWRPFNEMGIRCSAGNVDHWF